MSQRSQEFISRDRQLPVDIRPAPAGKLGGDLNNVPLGEPPSEYGVRSVYDSRPVNGFDFNQLLHGNLTVSQSTLDLTFIVPAGFVAVMRQIEYWTDPPVNMLRSEMTMQPLFNGAVTPYNTYAVGSASDKPMEVFVIADQDQSIGVRLSYTGPALGMTAYAQIYGNLLLKSGRAAPFEIANFVGDAAVQARTAEQLTFGPT